MRAEVAKTTVSVALVCLSLYVDVTSTALEGGGGGGMMLHEMMDHQQLPLPKILSNLPPYTGPPSVSRRGRGRATTTTAATTVPTPEPTLAPYIEASTPTNVTVIKGKTAMLACVVRNLGTAKVSWMRLSDITVMSMNEKLHVKDSRLRVSHVPESDRWVLRIDDVAVEDESSYECQVTTAIKTSSIVHLNVLDPQTEILGSAEVFLSKGSTLNLTCVITKGPITQPFIIWTHNSKMLKYITSKELSEGSSWASSSVSSASSMHGQIVTQIVVAETDVSHSGTYQCEPGAAPTAKVKVHVIDGKFPAAMQTAGGRNDLHTSLYFLLIAHMSFYITRSTLFEFGGRCH